MKSLITIFISLLLVLPTLSAMAINITPQPNVTPPTNPTPPFNASENAIPSFNATENVTANITTNATKNATENITPSINVTPPLNITPAPLFNITFPPFKIEELAKPLEPGSLKKIVGHVFIIVEGEQIRLYISDRLYNGDTVQTDKGGLVSILAGPQEVLMLNEESNVEITKLGNNETGPALRLNIGEIYIEKEPSERSLLINASDETPGTNIESLKGSFSIEKREGVITIKVYSGSVDVYDNAKNVTVRVRENEKLSVKDGELPPSSPQEFVVVDKWWTPVTDTGICGASLLIISCVLFVGLLRKS